MKLTLRLGAVLLLLLAGCAADRPVQRPPDPREKAAAAPKSEDDLVHCPGIGLDLGKPGSGQFERLTVEANSVLLSSPRITILLDERHEIRLSSKWLPGGVKNRDIVFKANTPVAVAKLSVDAKHKIEVRSSGNTTGAGLDDFPGGARYDYIPTAQDERAVFFITPEKGKSYVLKMFIENGKGFEKFRELNGRQYPRGFVSGSAHYGLFETGADGTKIIGSSRKNMQW